MSKRAKSVITGCALADKFGATWRDSTNPSIAFMVSVGGGGACQITNFYGFLMHISNVAEIEKKKYKILECQKRALTVGLLYICDCCMCIADCVAFNQCGRVE